MTPDDTRGAADEAGGGSCLWRDLPLVVFTHPSKEIIMPLDRWRKRREHKPQHAVPEELPITLEQIHKLGLWAKAHLQQLQTQWGPEDDLLARFTTTRYEIREQGAFVEVVRRAGKGGMLEWLVTVHPDPAAVLPNVVGVYGDKIVALQAAVDAIDEVVDETRVIIMEEEGD